MRGVLLFSVQRNVQGTDGIGDLNVEIEGRKSMELIRRLTDQSRLFSWGLGNTLHNLMYSNMLVLSLQ